MNNIEKLHLCYITMTTTLPFLDNTDMNGSFSFLRDELKQTKLQDNVFAVLAYCGPGMAQMYFANEAGDEIAVPDDFYLRDITNTYNIVDMEPIGRQNIKIFVLIWTNSYEFGYLGNKCKLYKQQQWAIYGDQTWDTVSS